MKPRIFKPNNLDSRWVCGIVTNISFFPDTDDSWDREKVIEIKLLNNGEVRFMENCDGYYWFSVPKEEAIAILQEVIDLIKEEG